MRWDKVKLGDVLKYEQPTNYIVASTDYNNEYETPVLTAGKTFLLGFTREKVGIFNDVPVIIFDDFTTAIKYVDFPFKVKSSAMKILKANPILADIKFLFYRMSVIKTNSTEHKRYWISKYSKLEIPLPPLETQRKIAAILDKAEKLVQNDKKTLEKYDQLAKSVFLEMFGDPIKNSKGWEVRKFGDHIEYLGDIGSNGSNETVANNLVMSDKEDYAIMIRTVNLNANNFSENIKYISKKTYDFFSKSQIFGGEIIMNKIGSAGEFWIMPNLDRPVSLGLNQFVIRLKSLKTIYLYSFLSTNYGKLNIKARIRGVATKSITKSAVRELPLLYPPIEFQNRFAKIINHIETQKQLARQSLQKSEELFLSLLQGVFKGGYN